MKTQLIIPIGSKTSLLLLALLSAITIAVAIAAPTHAADGANFRADNIISDGVFYNGSSMSVAQIQSFLNAKIPTCDTNGTQTTSYYYSSNTGRISSSIFDGGSWTTTTRAVYGQRYNAYQGRTDGGVPFTCMRNFTQATPSVNAESGLCNAYTGGTKTAAQIIYDVSKSCGVNPQVLLVLLQKEQSLVTDEWPQGIQFRSATGFACPDTAACDPVYYGFFNQVFYGARQYKKYARDASSFNYQAGRNNSILWNPQSSCGASTVYIKGQATAGLYNYTPYRPNQAALNNMYGSGDSCSAYGNRNFWRQFVDWFGATTGGVSLIKSTSSPTIFALYGDKKQGIPTEDVLNAWGLNGLPITTLDDSYVAAIADRPVLTRLAKNPYSSSLYLLADNGGTYDSLSSMVSNWGLNPASASAIGVELVAFTNRLGSLSAFTTSAGSGGVYMIDHGTKKLFSTPGNLSSWSGSSAVITISSDLFTKLSNGTGVFSNRVENGANRYVLQSGNLLGLSSDMASLYPQNSINVISAELLAVLPKGSAANRFVKSRTSGTIYLVDGGKRHGIASMELLLAYTPAGTTGVTEFTSEEIGEIPNGTSLTTRFAYNTDDLTQQYYINNGKHITTAAFKTTSYGFSISTIGLKLVGESKAPLDCTQGIIQPRGGAGVYILDNGVKRGIPSLSAWSMLENNGSKLCTLDPTDVKIIPSGLPISIFVTNGGVNYLLDKNNKYSVGTIEAQSLGITSFSPVTTTFLANYTDAGALSGDFRSNDQFIVTSAGKRYSTTNAAIAYQWSLSSSSQQHSIALLDFITNGGSLTQYARPSDPNNGTIYLVNSGKFLPVTSLSRLYNTGYTNQNIPRVDMSRLNANIGEVWHGYIAREENTSNLYIIEGGKKHLIPVELHERWLGSPTTTIPTILSSSLLSLLTTGGTATSSITTGSPGIYGIDNGKKAGIPNLKTYLDLYSPALTVSHALVGSIPNGPAIPSH